MDEFLYAVRECFLNLKRYRARYAVFCLLIVSVSASVSFSAVITSSADRILDEFLPYYAPEGYYIPEEEVIAELPLSKDDVQSAEELWRIFRRIEILCTAALIMLSASVMRLNTDFRKADADVLNLCGIGEITVGVTIGAEMLIVGALSCTFGILLGYFASLLLFGFITPSFVQPIFPLSHFASGYSVVLLTDVLVTGGFIKKLRCE